MHESRSCQTIAQPGFDPGTFGLWAQHANRCTTPLMVSAWWWFLKHIQKQQEKNGGVSGKNVQAWDHLRLSVWRVGMTAVGFEPTPLRNGALSHRLRPARPHCPCDAAKMWAWWLLPLACSGLARPGEAPNTIAGSPTQDAPFTSRILSRKFSLVTRVSLTRLARFPWPRKDDTHRSVTAFFSRFPWPCKDGTHRSVTGFLRVVDANRFARQAACSVYVEGILWLVSSRL